MNHHFYGLIYVWPIVLRYRRSYDSEYSAPLVAYYIWPALMDGNTCVSKGEAFTKRGAVSKLSYLFNLSVPDCQIWQFRTFNDALLGTGLR